MKPRSRRREEADRLISHWFHKSLRGGASVLASRIRPSFQPSVALRLVSSLAPPYATSSRHSSAVSRRRRPEFPPGFLRMRRGQLWSGGGDSLAAGRQRRQVDPDSFLLGLRSFWVRFVRIRCGRGNPWAARWPGWRNAGLRFGCGWIFFVHRTPCAYPARFRDGQSPVARFPGGKGQALAACPWVRHSGHRLDSATSLDPSPPMPA